MELVSIQNRPAWQSSTSKEDPNLGIMRETVLWQQRRESSLIPLLPLLSSVPVIIYLDTFSMLNPFTPFDSGCFLSYFMVQPRYVPDKLENRNTQIQNTEKPNTVETRTHLKPTKLSIATAPVTACGTDDERVSYSSCKRDNGDMGLRIASSKVANRRNKRRSAMGSKTDQTATRCC